MRPKIPIQKRRRRDPRQDVAPSKITHHAGADTTDRTRDPQGPRAGGAA